MTLTAQLPEALRGVRLDGRNALVAGAGRGIGLAAAIGLAQAGAEVYLASRTPAELERAADSIRSAGGRAHPLVFDVTDTGAMQAAVARIPNLDILINNAGGNLPEPFLDVTEEHLDRILDLNVRAAFLVAQAAVRKMLEWSDRRSRGGAVINITSQMGHVGAPLRTVYCMTKHALEGLTKSLAVELAPQNIRVNSIAPGAVQTPINRAAWDTPAALKALLELIPYGRIGQPEDIGRAVAWLVSDDADYVHGQTIVVDGGMTLYPEFARGG